MIFDSELVQFRFRHKIPHLPGSHLSKVFMKVGGGLARRRNIFRRIENPGNERWNQEMRLDRGSYRRLNLGSGRRKMAPSSDEKAFARRLPLRNGGGKACPYEYVMK